MTKVHASLKAASEAKDDTISKSVPTFLVDPRTIIVQDGFNARPIDAEHVAYLKELKRKGVDTGFVTLQMIDGQRVVRDGHHRLAADLELIAEGVDIRKIKAIEFKGDEKAAIFLMLATQSGKPYTPMQLGEQYVKLVNTYGMTYSEVAAERGMSVQHVKDMVRLTEQPIEIKEMIQAGEVKAATALKLVKKEGATEAAKTLKAASAAGIKAGKPITQKVIDNLGSGVLVEAKKRSAAACEHIKSMLDSPDFDGPTKSVLKDVLGVVSGSSQRIAPKVSDTLAVVRSWLAGHKDNVHSDIKTAAYLLTDVLDKKPVPKDIGPGAISYGCIVWLQDMAAKSKEATFRAASHWFLAVLESKRTGRELAPAPSVMSFEDAMRAEMDSGGHVLAETLCPEQAELIAWVRGRA